MLKTGIIGFLSPDIKIIQQNPLENLFKFLKVVVDGHLKCGYPNAEIIMSDMIEILKENDQFESDIYNLKRKL